MGSPNQIFVRTLSDTGSCLGIHKTIGNAVLELTFMFSVVDDWIMMRGSYIRSSRSVKGYYAGLGRRGWPTE